MIDDFSFLFGGKLGGSMSDEKPNAHQDIDMQLDRLTQILDDLYNNADTNLGANNVITKRSLKAVLYFHALSF